MLRTELRARRRRRRESYLLNTNKARAHLYGGAPDSFQTENSYIVGIEPGISRTEVRVLTTELRRLSGQKYTKPLSGVLSIKTFSRKSLFNLVYSVRVYSVEPP